MPAPILRTDVHVDKPLSNFAVAFANAFKLGRMVTPVTVPNESDIFFRWEQNARRVTGMKRADGTVSTGVKFGLEQDTFREDEYAVHTVFGSRLLKATDPALNLLNFGAASLLSLVRLEYEFQIFTLFTTDANYASNNTVTLTSTWGDYVNGDPKGDVDTAVARIRRSNMQLPPGAKLRLALPVGGWNKLKNHPDVKEQYKYTDNTSITTEMVAKYLEIDEVISVDSVLNAAAQTPDTMTNPNDNAYLWPDTTDQAILAVVNEGLGGAPPDVSSFSGVHSFGSVDETMRRWANNEELASAKGPSQFMEGSKFFVLEITAVDTKASGKGTAIYQIKNILS